MFITLGLESEPLTAPGKKLNIQDVARVKQLLSENDPRKLQEGTIERMFITERDLNLFLDYVFSRSPKTENLSAQVMLHENQAKFNCTLILPDNPFGIYLNISVELIESAPGVSIDNLKVGAIPVPRFLLKPVLQYVHNSMLRYEEYKMLFDGKQAIENIQFIENNMMVTYRFKQDMLSRLQAKGQNLLLPAEERGRLRIYYERVEQISSTKRKRNISLARYFQPLFQLARKRTVAGNDPAAENRALILSLTMYVTKRNVNRILGIEEKKKH